MSLLSASTSDEIIMFYNFALKTLQRKIKIVSSGRKAFKLFPRKDFKREAVDIKITCSAGRELLFCSSRRFGTDDSPGRYTIARWRCISVDFRCFVCLWFEKNNWLFSIRRDFRDVGSLLRGCSGKDFFLIRSMLFKLEIFGK